MNIHELDSYNLADAVKFNEELNPRIWQGSRMRPEVRRKLLAIARDFKQSLGLSDLEVKDITLSGSNAGYTYTPHSDIDLHLVVDVPRNETDEVYRELFNAKKYQYNDEHNLSIGGYPVELYVQPANQTHHSQGIYSVLNNDWTAIPRKRESTVNDGAVKSKYELMKHRIDSAIDSGDIKRLTRTAARIKQMRQAGLDKNGELGPENLAYKMLRTQGLIEKLYTARTAAKDQQLSLQERKKKKKSRVRYGFGGYYTPGFSFGGEAGEGGGDGGGGESVREDATISPYGVSPTTQMFLNETGDSEQTVYDFISHAAEQLGIENMPHVELHTDPAWSEREHSFGRYTPNTHTLEVNLANRHIMDILRTVAHELVHCRQHELSPLPDEAGETGSRWENEAHAKAGELMRDYADANPTKFGEHALAEASGYIPTKAQARDPRFSTALSVDVHPGQTGREANKMALQTDAQGRPALLIKGLANQLHEEFAQFDESISLFEIKMTGKNLRAEAAKTGAIAGMEFEMIVPNVEGGDDDEEGNMEPDYEYDEGVSNIQGAYDFFYDGDYNSRGDVTRLREKMQNEYYEWLGESFDTRWESDESEFVYNYLKENASTEEIAEILGIELDADNYPDTVDRQAYRDATEKVVEASYGNYWYDAARESAQEDFNQNADLESDWLEDRDLNTMQDIEREYNMNWPHWNSLSSGGDRSIEDVANDFQDAIGTDVQASTNYHAGSVDRPSPSSHHYVVEPDGSLTGDDPGDRGLEFVSPPLPIDVILNDLSKVKRWADSYGCYTNDSTGLHINISVPEYSRDKLDFVKLAILMGDEHVSDSFGRLGAYYAKSAMGMIRDNVRSRPEAVTDALEKMRTHMNTAASKAVHSGVTAKFTSINVKDGHIEFRSPGGDWLGENFDKIENTLLRFTVAMSAALNPEMYREEYLKKLYKILNPDGQKDEYGDMIQEFSKYMASLQGGEKEASGKLSKETQQAIKDFRTAATKQLKQKNLANKLKKGDTAGQKYWWKVSNPGISNAGIEVVATTKQEAIEKAISDDGYPSWANNLSSLVAKPLSPYYEKSKPSVWKVYGSNSSPYQRLGTEVVATDEFEAMQKARQKWNLNVGGRTEEEFFSTNGWSAERIGDAPAEQTTKYEIYNKQTGNSVEPADGITNDADALVRLNDYIEHGPHALQRGQASRMFGIRTTSGVEIVDIDIPMAQGRAATSVTGQWKVVDGLNRELYRFRPAENTRAKANELAALWARENNFDGNYQVEPAEDTAPALTPDQQQGGLIDVAGEQPAPGSTTDLAQQRAVPGTFTGAWKIIDNDGNEMHRFSGVGNNQRDANRVATQWIQNNGYAYGTEIEVVPIMSESIAEGFSNSPQTVTRIDSKPITDFVSSLKAYKHTDDWSQSGVDTGDDSYWKKKNLKTNTTKGLFAGDPHRTALYATGNAHETRYVEFTQNGQPVVYFDQKDLPAMRSRKTYLTVFDAANFKKLPTGEYFSENPGQPLTQTEISDPFQYIASQGWIVRVTPDLNKVFKQVQYMHQNRKIQQYGAEGMSESIAEGSSQNQGQVRQTLNAWMNQDQQFKDPTQRAGFQAKVWPYIQKNINAIISDKGKDGLGGYPAAPYAAWLLVQHMDAYPQNQLTFLNWLEKSGLNPDGKLQFLKDRAAVNQWIAANANKPEYFINGKPLPNPTVNVRNPAMFKDAGIVATSREEALQNAQAAGNKLLVSAVQATNAQTQPSYKQGVAEGAGPDKKYTIKKSYTMSKAGVEKSVWHIMDGDFVVDVTDLRRDAKYYADKWNAAEKESSNASQNLHKQDVAEGKHPGKSVTDAIQKVMPMAQEIWFHGSRATGSHRRNSDTDILVVVPDNLVGDQYLAVVRILQKLSAQFDKHDIQPTKSGTNIHRIAQEEGQLLWSNKQDVTEGLNEFAPSGQGGSDSGRWYTDDELADIIGDDWFEDFDVSHDEFNIDTHGEKAKQNLASYANSWFDDKGYNVNVMGVEHNEVDHDLKWYIVGSFHNPRFANEGVEEGIEFFSTPLRMSEYRGKHHPATEEPYDAKFKFSGDLKDRVHSLLDAGTKPTLLQVNPRHLLATQDWLSTQGGGRPPFATMKQHPVVLQKNNRLYILDGHHRSADALNTGTSIEVYLFKDEL